MENCGYSIPHPSENKINLRVQTYPHTQTTSVAALHKGLHDVRDVCTHTLHTFKQAVRAFNNNITDDADSADDEDLKEDVTTGDQAVYTEVQHVAEEAFDDMTGTAAMMGEDDESMDSADSSIPEDQDDHRQHSHTGEQIY